VGSAAPWSAALTCCMPVYVPAAGECGLPGLATVLLAVLKRGSTAQDANRMQ